MFTLQVSKEAGWVEMSAGHRPLNKAAQLPDIVKAYDTDDLAKTKVRPIVDELLRTSSKADLVANIKA